MSLGLGDLKKKTVSATTQSSASSTSAKTEWSSQTARPWDASGLTRGPKARKRTETTDAVMNDEWSDSHSTSLYQFESFNDVALEQLQEVAVRLQNEVKKKIKRATSGPLQILKTVVGLIQK